MKVVRHLTRRLSAHTGQRQEQLVNNWFTLRRQKARTIKEKKHKIDETVTTALVVIFDADDFVRCTTKIGREAPFRMKSHKSRVEVNAVGRSTPVDW